MNTLGATVDALILDLNIPSETMVQNTIRTLAYGPYTATYIRWGKALDLHGQNRVDLMGHTFHGEKNQQARASFPFLFSLGADRPL